MSLGFSVFGIAFLEGGLVWGLLALGGMGAVAVVPYAGLVIWDRVRGAAQPQSISEVKEANTASEEAATLLEYVRDILARARLTEDDRSRLVDVEHSLVVQVAGSEVVAGSGPAPYDENEAVAVMLAEVIAEQLITGGGGTRRTVPGWTLPTASGREALCWFRDNVFRIVDADYEAWNAEQPDRRRRRVLPGQEVTGL